VSQVRLQPVVEQNVVSYVTVIDVPNPDLRLKPGMTANVTVEIARAEDVLRVPAAALRLRPSAAVSSAQGQRAESPDHGPHVWVVDDGRLTRVPVTTGVSDGTRVAVTSPALREGAAVVTSIAGDSAGAPASTSPLLPAFRGRGPGARGTGGAPSR
jgi:HlyD family secretion protein